MNPLSVSPSFLRPPRHHLRSCRFRRARAQRPREFVPPLARRVRRAERFRNPSCQSEVVGGSAWGAAAVASGDGSRQVTEKELSVAKLVYFPKNSIHFLLRRLTVISDLAAPV